MRVEWISHKGKKILFINYSEIKSQGEMLEVLNESLKIIREASGTILALSDMTNASVGPDFMKEAKEKGKELAGKAEKTAILGITGLKSMLLKGYNLFTGETMKPFSTREEALDYLAS